MTNHPIASRRVPAPGYQNVSSVRHALTLVEMLVGMAITLVMMAAVVNLFANISEGVRNRRATMEVSASLRIARARLYNDLAGATCLKYPKDAFGVMPKPDVNNPPDGYFEYVEGQWSDDNPSHFLDGDTGNGELQYGTSLIPSSNLPFNAKGEPVDPAELTDGLGLGDYDDILAMTVESTTERFRGKGRGLRPGGDPRNIGTLASNYTDGDWVDMAISSPVAEVVWFATQNPLSRSEGEPGMRKIYRRVVLVTPWYGTETKVIAGNPETGSDPLLDLVARNILTPEAQVEALRLFQDTYDISVRLENGRLVPNTLADLARREHRFAHAPNDSITPTMYFPHRFPYDIGEPEVCEEVDEGDSSLRRLQGEREGEDLVLTDVLGFDVQIFDPGAPLFQDASGSTLTPPDLGWRYLATPANPTPTPTPIGFGAYVDLYWANVNTAWENPPNAPIAAVWTTTPNDPVPLFGALPALRSDLDHTAADYPSVSYDTWTTYYETDGIDQDNRDNDANFNTGADEGTNGLDDPDPAYSGDLAIVEPADLAMNGPDDPGERETSPPYPYPLKGIQVKLRVYEPESRQIRETTVTRNLEK